MVLLFEVDDDRQLFVGFLVFFDSSPESAFHLTDVAVFSSSLFW